MVGIQGIGGVPEPRPDRSSSVRDSNSAGSTPPPEGGSQDDVLISPAAQAAALVAKTISASQGQPEIRADKVEAAKLAIERGDFKDPDVVRRVAQRIDKLL